MRIKPGFLSAYQGRQKKAALFDREPVLDQNIHRQDQAARIVKTITGSVFLATLGIGVFTFSFPLLAKDLGIAGAWFGIAFSGYFFAKLILAPFAGAIADRIGPRPPLIFSTLLGMLLPFFYFLFPTHVTLYLIQFGLGFVGGIMKPVGMAVIGAESSEENCGRLFGWYNVFFNIAFMSGPLLGGVLFYQRKFEHVLFFLELCMLASLLILVIFLPKNITSSKNIYNKPLSGLNPEKKEGFFQLLLAVVGRTAGIAVMISFYPILLSEKLFQNSLLFGLLFSIPSIVTSLFLPLTGRLADRFNKRLLTFVGMLSCSFGLLLMGKIHSVIGFIIIGLIIGIGSGISIPASMSMASNFGDNQGKIMGAFHGAANAGFIIGPILGGFVVRQTMGIPMTFMAAGIIGTASCLPLGISLFKNIWPFRPGNLNIISAVSACLALSFLPVILSGTTGIIAKETFHFADLAMGTIVRFTLIAPDENAADKAAKKAFDTIHRLEKDFGHRHSTGSIGRINLSAGVKPAQVTGEAYRLIERAVDFCEKTKGVFDISIGAVTVTPNYFYENSFKDKKNLIDYRLIQLNVKDKTVFLPKKGMALDLGGLAKGTIIDYAARSLKDDGMSAGIVEAGGDFFCFGNKEWKSGIQHPRRDELLGVILIKNRGVCGCGDYYQYIIGDEGKTPKRRHHIINPEKMASARRSISVTVISSSSELADALATTLFIMGPDKGKLFLQSLGDDSSALWMLQDLKTIKTDNFPSFLTE